MRNRDLYGPEGRRPDRDKKVDLADGLSDYLDGPDFDGESTIASTLLMYDDQADWDEWNRLNEPIDDDMYDDYDSFYDHDACSETDCDDLNHAKLDW